MRSWKSNRWLADPRCLVVCAAAAFFSLHSGCTSSGGQNGQPVKDAGADVGAPSQDALAFDGGLPDLLGRDQGPGAPDLAPPTDDAPERDQDGPVAADSPLSTDDAPADVGSPGLPERDAETGLDGPTDARMVVLDSAGGPDVPYAVDAADLGVDTSPVTPCPPDMALIGIMCVDRYEASRPDATRTSAGNDESRAVSVAGVLPWYVNPMTSAALATFEAACEASGKRLCDPEEWLDVCQGPEEKTYFFGNTWDPAVCNSVDTYCQECCDALGDLASCPMGENCGYSSALTSSYTPETCGLIQPYNRDSCHVCYRVMPTGAFPGCKNDAGIYDVNGNVWEVVPVPTNVDGRGYQIRGGAFNCGSPSARFRCDFDANWNDLYAGFRCCREAAL